MMDRRNLRPVSTWNVDSWVTISGGNSSYTGGGWHFQIFTTTASGTLTVKSFGPNSYMEALVVGGGGAGGYDAGGGGAGGGVQIFRILQPEAGDWNITRGVGGTRATTRTYDAGRYGDGKPSYIESPSGTRYAVSGGGMGGYWIGANNLRTPNPGGGGGGDVVATAGVGTQGPNGYKGGDFGSIPTNFATAGGAGASANGGNQNGLTPGAGGAGLSVWGTLGGAVAGTYGGGGGGAGGAGAGGSGGVGGGGNGQSISPAVVAQSGTAYTGGGGGGGASYGRTTGCGDGGSGIVIVRVPTIRI